MGRCALLLGGVALAAGLLQAAMAPLLRAAAGWLRIRGWRPHTAAAATAAALSAPIWCWLAVSASAGRRLATAPGRTALVVGVTLALMAGTFLTVGGIGRRLPRRLSPAIIAFGVALLGLSSAGLLWIDGIALARRYPWFHTTIQLAAFASAQLAAAGVLAPIARRRDWTWVRRWLAPSLALLLLVACWQSARDLWSPLREDDRAQIFSGGGIVASTLDTVKSEGWTRPARILPAPAAGPLAPEVSAGSGLFAGSNVVLITVDALRADHLGLYGYPRRTSPRLDDLARRSVVFERAYTHSPHTSYALASLMTGRHAFSLGRAGLMDELPTLADAFRAARYRTIGIYPPAVFFVEGERFRALERRQYGFAKVRYESLDETQDAVVRTDQALQALAEAGREPVFMWLHHFGPHEPYVEHPGLDAASTFGPREVDRYDQEIAWVDREIGRLLDGLERHPLPTVVIVTADHGEEFGEHGGAYHGTSLFDEQIRVPLLIHLPGVPGHRVAGPVSTVDLAPTLMGLTGLAWTAPLDGVDRGPEVLGTPVLSALGPRSVFAELETWKAVVRGDRKLICDIARDFCRLYDLSSDPRERLDLARKRRGEVRELRAELERWLRRPDGGAGKQSGWTRPSPSDVEVAAQRGDRSALASVARRLFDPTVEVNARRRAAKLIARTSLPEHRRAAEAAWSSDTDSVVRMWAGFALLLMGDLRPLPLSVEATPLGELDPDVAAYRALALHAAKHPEAVPALAKALPPIEDVNLRCRVLAALGQTRSPKATAALIGAYPHIRSRICVAEALAEARDPGTVPFLTARLEDEPYTTVRAAVTRALGRTGDASALAAVTRTFMSDAEEVVVAAAARALAELGAAARLRKGRALRAPPAAKELWLVTSSGKGPLRVVLSSSASKSPRRSQVDTTVVRDAYAFMLPAESAISVWVSRPARYALFR